jgi:putative SOS response-associated peptidase YedK
MCGRISIAGLTLSQINQYFSVDTAKSITPSYNIAPSFNIPAIRQSNGLRALSLLYWGLIPHWSKDKTISHHTFNARLETLTQKPSFRTAFKTKRCLIVASGFYEWHQAGTDKTPYYIHHQDNTPLALAGLWDCWVNKQNGERIESCSIITRPAAEPVSKIHKRMPAILDHEHFDVWLDPQFKEPHILQDILRAAKPLLRMYPVSKYVNSASHDGEKCIGQISVN